MPSNQSNLYRLVIRLLSWLSLIMLITMPISKADVVKPALIEITANTSGTVSIEVRASIEALLTGINSQYKDTREAPNGEAYDELRKLEPAALQTAFKPFYTTLLDNIKLKADDQLVPLSIEGVDIPPRGYTKVPRISTIVLTGKLDRTTEVLSWHYPQQFGDNAVRVRQIDDAQEKWFWSEYQWIRSNDFSKPFPLDELFTKQATWKVALNYIDIGFDHIIPMGIDHILFILGLFFFSTKIRPLIGQVTMFTIAHTITLGLAMAGIVNLPANIVEPLIALSIAYVALENIFLHNRFHNSRLLLVFGFGLLHGVGFAGALTDFGMPNDAFVTALVSFNIGVEIGQLTVLALAFVATVWFRQYPWYRPVIVIPISLGIALIGLYWTVERLEWL